ncbi:Glycosyl transferases group 1 [Faunimonas pinastri]|uniref:Glycosyl transferases group 1 n=1 Tax=Faunimonas pinastri TaxID=1855383 RepID=A0A1H9F9U6_9HYPH|nr:glycosyltransferase [Faunimonas pinastri]SEQ34704.1 Glycosyl transferases group 1 [Faunimonas pinastri]
MSRIVYVLIGTQRLTGGHKMIVRHVEALKALGYPAVLRIEGSAPVPDWFSHDVEVESGTPPRDGDVLVIPEDATAVLKHYAASPHRKIVFCQNHFYAAANGLGRLTQEELASYREFVACSRSAASWIARFLPHRSVDVLPAFADERRFRPGEKQPIIACASRKRPLELRIVNFMFRRLYGGKLSWRFAVLEAASEEQVARTFAEAHVFLSLSRLEGLGMTTLEAMASECVVAGFTGIGGREYATSANGFWVEEDDCEACAHALVKAVTLVERGGPGAQMMRGAAAETAAHWSHARFIEALDRFWSRTMAVR